MSRPRTSALTVLVVALALGLGSSAVLAPEADALVSISTLTVVDGSVLISHAGSGFAPAREGEVVAAGDTIRTESGAAAEITYFEGSSVRLEADTPPHRGRWRHGDRDDADARTHLARRDQAHQRKLTLRGPHTELDRVGARHHLRGRRPCRRRWTRRDRDDERGRRRPQRCWTSWGGERGARDSRPRVDEVREPARRVRARGRACDPSRSTAAAGVGAAPHEDGCVVIGSCGGANEGAAGGSARHHAAEGPRDDIEDLKAATERIGDS